MRKLKILFLTPRFIYPVIGGDRVKPYNIVSHLCRHHDVTLVSFFQGKEPPDRYVKEIRSLGPDFRYIPLNPIAAGIKCALKLPGKKPLEINYYYSREYKKLVARLCREKQFDVGFAFFMRTAEYLKDVEFGKILMAEDCRTLYQLRSYKESKDPKQRLVRRIEYKKLRKYEPEIVNYFDTTTLVSNEDIESMKTLNSEVRYRLLTNGVDTDVFIPPEDNSKRKNILFAGKLDIWANELMLQNIVTKIMPAIKEEIPDVKLIVAGASPTPGVRNLAARYDFVELHPDVPEMQPYLQSAALFLHPHTGGSGIQNKLLEAMACGCPVVTTKTGNQGIYGENGKDILIGSGAEQHAENAVRILKDHDFAEYISANARNLIVRTHSWESVFEAADNIIKEITG